MATMLKWLEWESVSGYPTCFEMQCMYIFYDVYVWSDMHDTFFKA